LASALKLFNENVKNQGGFMLKAILALSFFTATLMPAQTWSFENAFLYDSYSTYEGGYFDDSASSLYDSNDDWYYDYHVIDPQLEEDIDLDSDKGEERFDWETTEEIF
jgi:hypothetical protein